MRNTKSKTPTTKKGLEDAAAQAESTSGKKLVQARLPFKIIASCSTVAVEVGADESVSVAKKELNALHDARKRKLSFDEDDAEQEQTENILTSKENIALVTKKKKTVDDLDSDIIVLDDEDELPSAKGVAASPHTPREQTAKRKGAGTPNSASNIKIKLPIISGKKNKRKKTARKSSGRAEPVEKRVDSSDDIEVLADELNPQKRPKLDKLKDKLENVETIDLDDDSDNEMEAVAKPEILKDADSKSPALERSEIVEVGVGVEEIASADIEADDEAEDCASGSSVTAPEATEDPVSVDSIKEINSPKHNNSAISAEQKKNLTPKQLKLIEQRRMVREEKERKLQEEKMQKQREKEEKELARKRERDEKEEQRRKEREEKDEQRRKERDEKERKRLSEIEAKNEEKRKRNEAKEEELRKKDDERKRKEQEKEESEMRKKKAAEAFTKFFVPKSARPAPVGSENEQTSKDGFEGDADALAFRPFQIKGDMKLAPVCRKILETESREKLDSLIGNSLSGKKSDLYLSELKSGKITTKKWRRVSTETKENEDSDVFIIEDDLELERAGQAIVEDSHGPVERLRAKFYKFANNRRPPYYGTWRKKSNLITARRPFAQDKVYFDYDLDSDLDWEEEEPGESLDGSDDEDKEKESEDDDYEVDNEWFVPHGHLSDEELQNEDECGIGDDNTREAQKAKLKIMQQEFVQEMKKKTEKIKPRLLGCIWADENGNQPEMCPKIIWHTLNVHAMLYTVPPLVEEPTMPEKAEPSSPTLGGGMEKTSEKLKPIVLTEKMLQNLIRLVHGNRHSKVFLIKEFIAFVEANEEAIKNGDVRGPLKSAVREKIDEFAEWQITEATNKSKKKKNKKRLCWIVGDDILKRMDLESLGLHNNWQYILQPKFIHAENETNADAAPGPEQADDIKPPTDPQSAETIPEVGTSTAAGHNSIKVKKRNSDMKKFTKIISAEEKAQQLSETACAGKHAAKHSIKKANQPTQTREEPKTATVVTPAIKKRVPLLMSVRRGQQISTPAKNALISQFLKKESDTKNKAKQDASVSKTSTSTSTSPDDVIIIH